MMNRVLWWTVCSDEDEDGEEGGGPLGDYDDEDEDDEGSEGGEVGLSYLTKEGIQVRDSACLITDVFMGPTPYVQLHFYSNNAVLIKILKRKI